MKQPSEMTREELLEYINQMQTKRAFTYEDRMKLTILDSLPFTVWASDRNCIVRLWEGRCESLYGYKKEEVLGKDYVTLFVAIDEQAAARRDQLEIIDKNVHFHNIANDCGRNGNTLRLITNCSRIIDPDNGDYLNAEMGVSIDYYEDEKRKLEENIAEGRRIQSFNAQFSMYQSQHETQFQDRYNSIWDAIRKGKREAAKHGRIEQYQTDIKDFESELKSANRIFKDLLLLHLEKISECVTYADCERVEREYIDAHNDFLNQFSDLAVQLEVINRKYSDDEYLTAEKDEAMHATSIRNSRLLVEAQALLNEAEKNYADYKALGIVGNESKRLQDLSKYVESAKDILSKIPLILSTAYKNITTSSSEEEINKIKEKMDNDYSNIEHEIEALRKVMVS